MHMKKSFLLIGMVLVFIVGIFANLGHMETVSGHVFGGRNGFVAGKRVDCVDNKGNATKAQVLPIESYHEIDDFYIANNIQRNVRNESETIRGAVFIIAVAALLFLRTKKERYQVEFGEGQIPFFHIVSFIHQTDGKKRACFEAQISNKTGGQKNGSWNKI